MRGAVFVWSCYEPGKLDTRQGVIGADALEDVMEWLGFPDNPSYYGWHLSRERERIFDRAQREESDR